MKRVVLITILLCFVCVNAFAQSTSKLTAQLVDASNGEPILGATVEYASTKKPDKKHYLTSGYNGSISISSLAYGDYNITITFIGYEPLEKQVTVKSATTSLGKIEMKPASEMIESVVKEVQALRTSQKGDTVSYNAGAFKVAADADVEGLLKKMPGINITNGEVEAQGEAVKKVFVDGKEFFGEDVTTAIQSLPAQAVDRIEVYNKLSDQAEFSGMDDGEGYKALNIVTHKHMRQGQFGKLYAGYGYDNNENAIANHKYLAGGNVNVFHGNHRVTALGLFNNINQQNFSFEDILGVTGGGGGMGPGRGVGRYMVRPQSGVARVGSIGVQYSDSWGKDDKVKLNGSYFYNDTKTRNKSLLEKWYEAPSPDDHLIQEGESETHNFNHRLNLRLDWKINENMSLMSRTNFSFQGNDPYSQQYGELSGESAEKKGLEYEMIHNGSEGSSRAYRFSEFLQYRVKIGKPGRTITVDGRYSTRQTPQSWTNSYSIRKAGEPEQYIASYAPQGQNDMRANVTYTEPVSQNSQVSLQYRFDYEDQEIDKRSYLTGSDYVISGEPDALLSSLTTSTNMEHRVGPGFRYSKQRNTFIANVYYQHSILDAMSRGQSIKRDYDNVTYFLMGNVAFNPQNTIRVFVSSYTQNPDVRNLQEVPDLTNVQFISVGNKDLRSSYTHRINFHYTLSNIEKGRTFMWMFSTQLTQDYIGQSVIYNPTAEQMPNVPLNSDGNPYTPLQYSTYQNMDGYASVRTHLSYGFPINPIKCNLNVMAGVSWSRTPSMIDQKINITSNMGYDAMLSLGSNISENIDFTLQWNGAYNEARQSLAGRGDFNQYFNHSASGTLKWVFWKGFTLTAAVNYHQYIGFTDKYNEDYLICNVYLGKKLFKNKQGEVLVGVNDLLNQNSAFARTVGSGYTQNSWNSVVGRYFTVQFNYNLRYFGKGASKNIDDYEGMGNKGKMSPFGPPMRR